MRSLSNGWRCCAGGYVCLQHQRKCSVQARAQRFQRAADSCRAHPRSAAATSLSTHACSASWDTHLSEHPCHRQRSVDVALHCDDSLLVAQERIPSPSSPKPSPNPSPIHTVQQQNGCLRVCGPPPLGAVGKTTATSPPPCQRQARSRRYQPVAGVCHRLPQVSSCCCTSALLIGMHTLCAMCSCSRCWTTWARVRTTATSCM